MAQNDQAAAFVREALKSKRLPRNQVAALSGLSNPYIQHLESGQIINVDRKKLIAFAVALNLSLHEIDDMLTVFDRAQLTEADVPLFLDPKRKSKITTAMLPLQVWFYYELVILSGERVPGRMVIVNDTPTANLMPHGFRTSQGTGHTSPHPVYFPLIEAIGEARRQNFMQLLAEHRVDHYICKTCLEEYIQNCPGEETRHWRRKHVESFLEVLETHQSLRLYLTEYCSKFNFTLKYPANGPDSREMVFFLGRSPHVAVMDRGCQLNGFATENPAVVQNFLLGLEAIEETVVQDIKPREKAIQYIHSIL